MKERSGLCRSGVAVRPPWASEGSCQSSVFHFQTSCSSFQNAFFHFPVFVYECATRIACQFPIPLFYFRMFVPEKSSPYRRGTECTADLVCTIQICHR